MDEDTNIKKAEIITDKAQKPLTKNQKTKLERMNRIAEIKKIVENIGLYNINKSELARKFSVTCETICNDIKALLKGGIEKSAVNDAMFNIHYLNRSLLKGLQAEFIKANNPKDKAAVAHALIALEEKMTDFLERYGLKEVEIPVADTHISVVWGTKVESGTNSKDKIFDILVKTEPKIPEFEEIPDEQIEEISNFDDENTEK